jgi:hypothetical protein
VLDEALVPAVPVVVELVGVVAVVAEVPPQRAPAPKSPTQEPTIASGRNCCMRFPLRHIVPEAYLFL